MDINSILKGVKCSCGKFHKCDIEYVFVEKDAIKKLENICGKYEKILIVADENTYKAAGEKVETALKDKKLEKVIFDGEKILIPDEIAIEVVQKSIKDSDLILGIGSGVIQDLCKYVSFFAKMPYMIVATAPSMDGYASDGAAMILKRMKETVKAHLPVAIIADVDVLKNAPLDMLKAGYGDIIGKYSALCDWKLSNIINYEYFCQYIYDTTNQMIENTLKNPKGILERDEECIKAVMEALVIVGIMMSFAGSSRPASGSEHHLSHFFEIVGIVDDKPYFPHGIDVAYSTVVTAKVRENLLASAFPDKIFREDHKPIVKEIYKSVADECIALQEKVGNYALDRIDIYKAKEKEIKKVMAEVPSSEEITKMLEDVQLYMKDFYEMYGIDKVETAVKYAKDLKDRYTVLWINYDLRGGEA